MPVLVLAIPGALICIAGCMLGGFVAPHMHQENLKRTFGVILIVMGVFIFYGTILTLAGA